MRKARTNSVVKTRSYPKPKIVKEYFSSKSYFKNLNNGTSSVGDLFLAAMFEYGD